MLSSTGFRKWGAGTYWCWRQSRNPWGGGGDRNQRTTRAGSDGKEVKTTSKNSLTNRRYSRYPQSLNAGFRIDGIKAMSRDFSGEKQAMKFGNTSNRRRVCLFYQNEKTILIMQNVQFEFRQVLRHYCLLNGHLRSLLHPWKKQWSLPPIICHYCL